MIKSLQQYWMIIILMSLIRYNASFSPNLQTNRLVKLANGKTVTISYVNMNRIENHTLQITPLRTVSVTEEEKCFNECVDTGGDCVSMNVNNIGANRFECEILNTDKYYRKNDFKQKNSTKHYLIVNKCTNNPCDESMYQGCIPNYEENLYKCYTIRNLRAYINNVSVSSIYYNSYYNYLAVPAKLIDGTIQTIDETAQLISQCFHTAENLPHQWVKLHFNQTIVIDHIVIDNALGYRGARTRDLAINAVVGTTKTFCENTGNMDGVVVKTFYCQKPFTEADYLEIKNEVVGDNKTINICECTVFGTFFTKYYH